MTACSFRRCLFWVAGILTAVLAGAQSRDYERGFRLIDTFGSEDFDAASQNWQVIETEPGLVYAGNLHGLLEFDGETWRLITLPNGAAALSLAADDRGRLAVGSHDDFAVLEADASGVARLRSLVPLIEPELEVIGAVVAVHAVDDGFLFVSTEHVFHWLREPDQVVVDPVGLPADPRRRFDRPSSFQLGAGVALWTSRGLVQWTDGEFAPVEEWDPRVDPDFVVERPDGSWLAYSADAGLLRFVPGHGLAALETETSSWLRDAAPTLAVALDDGRVAVGTRGAGIAILDGDGAILEIIDPELGLPGTVVMNLSVGRDRALWVATDVGLARVPLSNRISYFDERAGIQGHCLSFHRYRGELYLGTMAGVFRLLATPASESGARAHAVPLSNATTGPTFVMITVADELLLGGAYGIAVVGPTGDPNLVDGLAGLRVYGLHPDRFEPDLVWVGLREGMGVLRREADRWVFSGLLPGPRLVRGFAQPQADELWAATVLEGVLRWQREPAAPGDWPRLTLVDSYLTDRGEVAIAGLERGPRVIAADEVWEWDEAEQGFRREPELLSALAEESAAFFRMVDGENDDLWLNTAPPTVLSRSSVAPGSYRLEHPLVGLPGRDPPYLFRDAGTLWIGNEKGVFRYELGSRSPQSPRTAPRIRRLTADDQVLFGGADVPVQLQLPAERRRRFRFEFASLVYGVPSRYQYRLDPVDGDWSAWTEASSVEFTNLAADDYVFRVRSRSVGSEPSAAARFSFVVRAPWYGTPTAWLAFSAVAWLLLALVVRLRHLALRRRASQLEGMVSEKTAELAESIERLRLANATVEEKNALLAEANDRLRNLSRQDGLTGIANRRRLEEVLESEWNRAIRSRQPLALILVDLDHFKRLNDSAGHQEGDVALQRVARFLHENLRRTSDLVARYGGEEFLIVLPATDREGARQFAEFLRAGIEGLALVHPGVDAGSLTASFGVVAEVPALGQVPTDLVQRADRALYRAKAAGRNRVEFD